jgi:hypothetical protein
MERPDELNENAEVQQIKAEISETQTELQQTVAEIQERLSPSHLKEQATETVRDATMNVRNATIGRMQHMMNRTNPIPLAMIGIGAAWLLASKRSERQWNGGYRSGDSTWGGGESQYGSTEYISSCEGYRSPYAGSAYSTGDYSSGAYTTGSYSGGAESATRDWQAAASERTAAVKNRARTAAYQARNRWDSMLDENPMALGIAALAAGALVGAALPQTEVENEYLGETRDQVIDSAKSMATESVDKAKSVAQESVAKVMGTDKSAT